MSMIERVLYWVGIIVLVIALIGIKGNISKVEAKLSQVSTQTQTQSEE